MPFWNAFETEINRIPQIPLGGGFQTKLDRSECFWLLKPHMKILLQPHKKINKCESDRVVTYMTIRYTSANDTDDNFVLFFFHFVLFLTMKRFYKMFILLSDGSTNNWDAAHSCCSSQWKERNNNKEYSVSFIYKDKLYCF